MTKRTADFTRFSAGSQVAPIRSAAARTVDTRKPHRSVSGTGNFRIIREAGYNLTEEYRYETYELRAQARRPGDKVATYCPIDEVLYPNI